MNRVRVDVPLLGAILFLMGLGLVMVYSSSWAIAGATYHDPLYFLKRQIVFALIGVAALVVGALVDPKHYRTFAYPMLGLSLFLLLIVLVPGIGKAVGIARRWIVIGPVTLQAGEPAKFAIVCYLAMSLAKKSAVQMRTFQVGVLPHVVIPGFLIFLLVCEPDFGTAMMLTVITLIMLFVGGARLGYLAGALLAVLPVALLLIAQSPYRMRRIVAFLDPWAHRWDAGYQITESLMTFGSGGVAGLGMGDGRQKLFFLPAAHTDFIFSVIGEELGFMGVLAVILAFTMILVRGILAALKHQCAFLSFLSIGITSLLVVQAAFNMAVVLGVVPTKGLTLPFLSYGGSSLITSALLGGVLLRLAGDAHLDNDGDDEDSVQRREA
ncbi:MAG: putative lipid II flippase FtsW [Deltaproteobacteria bacterium]|nr:putative lipid II flippase FtsW [Deltaproteobacteria bacterium]